MMFFCGFILSGPPCFLLLCHDATFFCAAVHGFGLQSYGHDDFVVRVRVITRRWLDVCFGRRNCGHIWTAQLGIQRCISSREQPRRPEPFTREEIYTQRTTPHDDDLLPVLYPSLSFPSSSSPFQAQVRFQFETFTFASPTPSEIPRLFSTFPTESYQKEFSSAPAFGASLAPCCQG